VELSGTGGARATSPESGRRAGWLGAGNGIGEGRGVKADGGGLRRKATASEATVRARAAQCPGAVAAAEDGSGKERLWE
jgi:hypothetical protein